MNNVNILGYSERGVMNALFYGITYEKDEKKQRAAIEAIINAESTNETKTNYQKFDFYMEFSLSEFGSPDLTIIATDDNKKKTAFFVEAKVSNGKRYNINNEYRKFDRYLKNENNDKNHASNLFFQLGLKKCYLQLIKESEVNKLGRLIKVSDNPRKLGDNVVVKKLSEIIKTCNSFKFLAIIPKQKEQLKEYEFFSDVKFLYWEDLCEKDSLSPYLSDVIKFNGKDKISLIFNPK
ncbi:hypothetical protein [Xylanibacter oryzae]|uniref:hypothetical protein n=1 Tax=Xylanibacter oryzae TaxID=185293 RepID=UPI0005644CAA|nr:hypothetical protein [Xylanibacter oryzae]